MTWNYRAINHPDEIEPHIAIHEVFYDADGRPESWGAEPAAVVCAAGESLSDVLDQMRRALDKPTLTVADFVRREVDDSPVGPVHCIPCIIDPP